MRTIISLVVLCMILASPSWGQCALTTSFTGATGQAGNMFDIVAINSVNIQGFDVNISVGTNTVEIYSVTGGGSFVGNETLPANWTLIGSAPVTSTAVGTPTPVPVLVNTTIPAGATQGFYVTLTGTGTMWYNTGSVSGAVFASDPNIQFLEGIARSYPFGSIFNPRVWNGVIHYLPTAGSQYQVNQPGSSVDINGIQGSPCQPAQAIIATGTSVSITLASTNVGLPWDILLTIPEPTVPASGAGFTTSGGQVLNLNFAAPSFQALFNFGFSLPFVPVTIPFSLGAPTTISMQMVNFDPSLSDGFALSAPNEMITVACQTSENFDTLPLGAGVLPIAWTDGGGTAQWSVGTGTTPSTATGPLAGAFSPPNYMYAETSTPNSSGTFIMDTCQMDFTQLQNFTLNFRLSRLGATIGTLNVWQDDGTGTFSISLITYVGPEPTGADWTAESIPIVVPPTGTTVAFRFDYTAGGSFTGDIALDDFSLQ